jgi:hypothetical protein
MFTEDLTAFFNTDEHATAAFYNSLTSINGIFNEADLGQLGMVAGSNPTFLCAASSVAADPTGLALVVNSVNYIIRDIKPQDDGAVVLLELETQ